MKPRPVFLVTNDDGIEAKGLHVLAEELKKTGDVIVVAPSRERSAVGHAITLSDPLRVWEYPMNFAQSAYAVNGTPADCVKIACWAIMKKKPDVIVSGINLGANTGINTIYSGTVSAATEGAILGIPSFAVSLATYHDPNFGYAAKFAGKLSRFLLEKGLPKGIYLNVNVPPCPEEEIRGVAITRQGQAIFKEKFDRRIDPHGRVYYWLTGQKLGRETHTDVDDGAVQAGMVSVTPVHYDLTCYDIIESLKKWNLGA